MDNIGNVFYHSHLLYILFVFFFKCVLQLIDPVSHIAVIFIFRKCIGVKGIMVHMGVCFKNAQPCVEVSIKIKYSLMNI